MERLAELTAGQTDRLVMLVILLGALGGYALVSSRGRIGTQLRHLVLWALLFTGVAAGYGLWDGMQFTSSAVQTADGNGLIVRRSLDGQFHLTLRITGPSGAPTSVRFIVDTGASEMVLTQDDAAKLGFGAADLRYLGVARTANGTTRTAQVTLASVALEGHEARRVRALVNEGELHASLLGMGYLERFSRIEIARDQLRISF